MQLPTASGDILTLISQAQPGTVMLAMRDMALPATAGWDAWCEAVCATANIVPAVMQKRLDAHPGRWRGVGIATAASRYGYSHLVGGCSGDSCMDAVRQAPSLYGMLLASQMPGNEPEIFDVDLCLLTGYCVGDASYISRCVEQFGIMGQPSDTLRGPDTFLQPATATRQ